MKFLVITAVREFDKDVKSILKKSAVQAFSYMNVTGYGDAKGESLTDNWFAGNMHEKESVMFHVFVNEENIDTLFRKVHEFNNKQESQSRIHIAVLNIEKSN